MKENGKIDANYARILFYLQMESLQETVIDMQVQNRIVSMTIFNDNPGLKMLAEPLQQNLKAGLADKNYQLSGVVIKPFDKETSIDLIHNESEQQEESGVDIRI